MTAPQYDDNLIAIYRAFQEQVARPKSVLHPACDYDASPSRVFDAVTYVDINQAAMQVFRDHRLDAHGQDIREYRPTKEHDLLILLNPCIVTEWASQHLKAGGYILTNNYHDNATGMYKKPDAFEFVGALDFVEKDRRKEDNRVVYSQNLEGLFVPVQDFKELQQLRPDAHAFILRTFLHLYKMYRGNKSANSIEEKYRIVKEMMGESEELPAKRVAERYVFVKK